MKISEILHSASSQGYRANVVKPLSGLLIILLTATVLLLLYKSMILAYIAMGMSFLTFLSFIFSYFFCLIKNPDLLRSEKYNLEKRAIEKVAFTGDSMDNKAKAKVLLPKSEFVLVETINESNLNERRDNIQG